MLRPSYLRKLSICLLNSSLFLLLILCTSATVFAQGYGATDFLIADSSGFSGNRIAVYDQNLVFKHYLDTSFPRVTGLDFLPNGNLVAVGQNDQVKQYNPAGAVVSSFTDTRIGASIDIKVGPSNLLYIGTQSDNSVAEFTPAGGYNRKLGNKSYLGVAVLPGGVLWAGSNGGSLDVFNISTGELTTTITLDNGQGIAQSMYYSPSTNTVLMSNNAQVFERTTSGAFIRKFIPPGESRNTIGVTRGPGGDVFATYGGSGTVVRWKADGTFVSATNIFANVHFAVNIVWVGNTWIARSDFDGDKKTDPSIWNPNNRNWYFIDSSTNTLRIHFDWGSGELGDIAVPRDYDGDGKTDIAVWRPSEGNWYIVNSSFGSSGGAANQSTVSGWGAGSLGDIPVPADYDGDNKADVAVWRPSEGNWYIINSSNNTVTLKGWGAGSLGDKPVVGDYDRDGKADIAFWRPSEGNWYIINSSDNTVTVKNWGAGSLGDRPVQADYDGDGKTDIAVWRGPEGNWYVINSATNTVTLKGWGASSLGDIPVPGDYDGDGKADIAVWRPAEGNWYIINSSNNTVKLVGLGATGAVPAPNTYLPQ